MWERRVNPSVRWVQLLLLALLTAFVGGMWGLERTAIPLIARQDFGITSAAVSLSFIVGFGITKSFANLFAGALMDWVGRRRVLVAGWMAGVPVPFLIIFAPQWGWIVLANLLLGVNQGLCWTATILMMMDTMEERHRGLAIGLNEFVGYSGVALTTLATGFIAASFALRPHPFFLGAGLAALGLFLSSLLIQETGSYSQKDVAQSRELPQPPNFSGAFVAFVKDRTLLSFSQAGLMTKINDATVWGLFPLFLASKGLDVASISIVAAIYPLVWGVSQLGTGFLSDLVGRKPLIIIGMVLQALGISLATVGEGRLVWIASATALGIGTAAVYPALLAAVGDHAHPRRRASAIGIYRWFRDGGFVIGGLLAGLLADTITFRSAFLIIGGLNLCSALLVGAWMREPSRRFGSRSQLTPPL